MDHFSHGDGRRRGAPSRFPAAYGSISRTMEQCGSAMKPSTKRYVQSRGALRRELTACLRTGRALRVPWARSRGRGKAHVGPEVLISERPAEAADRAVPGH